MSRRTLIIWLCVAAGLLSCGAAGAGADRGGRPAPPPGLFGDPDADAAAKLGPAWRVPATVRQIDISSGFAHQSPAVSLQVTDSSLVKRIVKLFNAMPSVPPLVYMCPLLRDPKLITVTFRGSTGAPLAVATYADFKPWSGPSQPCKPLELRVGPGHKRAVIGGDFLHTLRQILGRPVV